MTPEGILAVAIAHYERAEGPPADPHAEEFRRAAIGRAYYAAFTCVRGWLESTGYSLSEDVENYGSTHAQVRKKFYGGRVHIREDLGTLFDMRCRADYEANFKPSATDVQNAINLANQIINKIKKLDQNKPK